VRRKKRGKGPFQFQDRKVGETVFNLELAFLQKGRGKRISEKGKKKQSSGRNKWQKQKKKSKEKSKNSWANPTTPQTHGKIKPYGEPVPGGKRKKTPFSKSVFFVKMGENREGKGEKRPSTKKKTKSPP